MGRQRIKLRTKEQAINYALARPQPYSRWMKMKLVVLGWLGLAKKYEASDIDAKTGVRTTVRGYACQGVLYLTEQEINYPSQPADQLKLASKMVTDVRVVQR